MLNAVLDTNIIVSAAISPNGNPAKIVNLVLDKIIQVYYSSAIISEYKEVLSRTEFGFGIEKQNAFILGIMENGIMIKPTVSNIAMPDEDDRIFYDSAKESGSILITGNMKHYPEESFIMTASDYLALFDAL